MTQPKASTTASCFASSSTTATTTTTTSAPRRRRRSPRLVYTATTAAAVLAFFSGIVATCTSEALVTSFLPRSLWSMRGGEKARSKPSSAADSLRCVLQVPPASTRLSSGGTNGDGGGAVNGDDHHHHDVAPAPKVQQQQQQQRKAAATRVNGGGDYTTFTSASFDYPNMEEVTDIFEHLVEEEDDDDDDASPTSLMDMPIPAKFVAETNLPTELGHFRLRAYRIPKNRVTTMINNEFVGNEPCVIYASEHPPFANHQKGWSHNVPVRIHDQCLTSEVFGSQRCDCKEQLKMSLDYIKKNGGVIIYLQQEGRGIGLANKVAAYALQDVGLDTVDANLHLGFPEDCRQYGVVPSILEDLKIASVKLLTNNPRKVRRLKALGVQVSETLPMVVPKANQHNRRYLETKQNRMNHENFGAMLSNGVMTPSIKKMKKTKMSLAEKFITQGEEMAAHAIKVSLETETEVIISGDVTKQTYRNGKDQQGVTAAEDGYCFGKQSVLDAVDAIAQGKMVVVVDDMDRENEGDLIMAADLCTPTDMAKIVRFSSGVVCIAMEDARMEELKLPPMVTNNEDPKGTAFTVSVDAAKHHGITTGISAADRSKTVQLLADPNMKASDFNRPGHIFPLRAREGGVLTRDGHTEASVDLARLAGRSPCGILCEIVSEDDPTGMARLPELKRFCQKHGLVLTSIVDIAQYRRETNQ